MKGTAAKPNVSAKQEGPSRQSVIDGVIARSIGSGKRVFGFTRDYGSCAEMPKKAGVPTDWDFMCLEGDEKWTRLPYERNR